MVSCDGSRPNHRIPAKPRVRSSCQIAIAVSSLIAISTIGCGGSGANVSGTVTFDGRPIANGTITFQPTEDSSLQNPIQARINDGSFSIESHQMLLPGKYEVAIRAERVAGQVQSDEGSTEMVDRIEQFIPVIYNSKTMLTAQVDGDVENLQFELQSQRGRSRRK